MGTHMPKFVLVFSGYAVNLEAVYAVELAGSDVRLHYTGNSTYVSISCSNSTAAQDVFDKITQAFDPTS